MATLTFFPVYGHWDLIDDAYPGGSTSDLRTLDFSGFIEFWPRIPDDLVLFVPSLDDPDGPEDTGVELSMVRGRIRGGDLSTINQADTPGVQLVADDQLIRNALVSEGFDQLIYDVRFVDVTMNGVGHKIRPFGFAASTDTTPVTITSPTLEKLEYCGPGSGYIFPTK